MNRPKISFAGVNELLGSPSENAVDIETIYIKGFKDHPFKIVDDDNYKSLMESIKNNGILNPVLVRPINDNTYKYEMISGHRRLHVANLLEMNTLPAIIKEMNDDEAIISMVDSNIQREKLLPSERAWSLRMKLEATKRQGKRNDLTSGNNCQKSTEDIGEEFGLKGRQARNYIRLTYLHKGLLNMVDDKRLPFMVGVEISYFDMEEQTEIMKYLVDGYKLTMKQVKVIRAYTEDGSFLSKEEIKDLLGEKETVNREFHIKENTIKKYFPENYTSRQIEETMMMLLEKWSKDNAAKIG